MRDNVVQVARDASALLHRGPVLKRVDHRFPCLVPFGERLTALATRITERLCRHDDHEQQHAGEPWAVAGERLDRVEEERERGKNCPAPPIRRGEQVEDDDEPEERRNRQRGSVRGDREEDTEHDRSRRPRDVSARERKGEGREQVRDHRRPDRVGVDRHLGHREQAECEREGQRPVGTLEHVTRVSSPIG